MSISHKITKSWSQGGETLTQVEEITSEGEDTRSIGLTSSQANKQVSLALDVSEVKSLYIQATQDITIYTNDASSGSPDDTIPVKAGSPLVWTEDSPNAISTIFTADITALYITNGAAAAATVEIRVLKDSTP